MADVRIDDYIGEVHVHTEDLQEIKSVDLLAHSFRLNDDTGEVAFADDQIRAEVMAEVERAILLAAGHGIRGTARS